MWSHSLSERHWCASAPVTERRRTEDVADWTMPGPAWLFCPADRPERFAKAAAAADVVILDLEDGVGADDRASARRALVDTPLDPARTVVRINPAGTPDQHLDLAALRETD